MLCLLRPFRALPCVTYAIPTTYILQLKIRVYRVHDRVSMKPDTNDVVTIDWILTTAPAPCPIWAGDFSRKGG